MSRDESTEPPSIVCQVGSTKPTYQAPAIAELHAWLIEQGDWVEYGAADEGKEPLDGTVEAWGRSTDTPVGGWQRLRTGYRGRFGIYMPLLEAVGMVELTHDARNDMVRAR